MLMDRGYAVPDSKNQPFHSRVFELSMAKTLILIISGSLLVIELTLPSGLLKKKGFKEAEQLLKDLQNKELGPIDFHNGPKLAKFIHRFSHKEMEREEDKKLKGEIKDKISQIFKDFLTRVAKLDELVADGGRLLTGFKQGLEFLRRPPINKTSKLIENIIKANGTNHLKLYLEAGCINSHDRVQNMSKLRTCLLGVHDHLIKVKSLVNDLKCLLEDATAALETANEHLSPNLLDMESIDGLALQESSSEDEITSYHLRKFDTRDYAALMGIVYSMVKQDYVMQDKTVTSLNLKSSSEEVESYCLMWSLRPYVNDQIMHLAWKLVP